MDSDSQRRRIKRIIAGSYALLYGSVAPLAGYLNLYLSRKGLTESTIGTVGALMALMGLIATPLWGYISDRTGDRRLPLVLGSVGSALSLLLMLEASFPLILLSAIAFSLFNSPLIAILDAFTLERLGADRQAYGPLRAWGSAGFIAMMFWFGLTLNGDRNPASLLPALSSFIFLRLMLGLLCSLMPTDGKAAAGERFQWNHLREWFSDRQWAVFLIISFLSMATNAAFFAFFPLYLSHAGVSDNWQGYFWVVAVVAETAFMAWLSGPLMIRIGLKGLLLLGMAGRAVRFACYISVPPFWILALCQLFHSLTFGAAYTASVAWVGLRSHPRARALSQGLFSGVLSGAAMALGSQWGGWMIEKFGMPSVFFAASAINAVCFVAGWRWLAEPMARLTDGREFERRRMAVCLRKEEEEWTRCASH